MHRIKINQIVSQLNSLSRINGFEEIAKTNDWHKNENTIHTFDFVFIETAKIKTQW